MSEKLKKMNFVEGLLRKLRFCEWASPKMQQIIKQAGPSRQLFETANFYERTVKVSHGHLHPSQNWDLPECSKTPKHENHTKSLKIKFAISLCWLLSDLMKLKIKGTAILLVSVELDEIMSLSDRIIVMNQGTIVGETNSSDATELDLGKMMSGLEQV